MSGRIPQQFIDDLLDRVDIVDVVDARVSLRKSGKSYTALCPFHDEKSPSFSVSPDKQFYYCFGCGAGGNAIGFLMEYERLEFPEAVEKLAAMAGLEVPREGAASARAARQGELIARLESASQWFRRQLAVHANAGEARAYLERRGLDAATVESFGIGYAPPGWESLAKALGADDASRKQLIETGLLIARDDGSCYDRFRDRIMFPIRDTRGRTVAFGGRVLTDEKPKYLNSPESSVFHKSQELYGLNEACRASRELERVLVVEGYMDVVMLARHGVRNACGTLGTALTASHLQRLFRHTSALVFCFDGDEAGRRAAARSLELVLPVLQDGRQVSFLFLPEGEDPDSLVREIGADAFRDRMHKALPLSEYLFAHFSQDLDLELMDGRARFSKLALPAINRIPGTVLRELMRSELAERVGVDVSRLPGASPPSREAPPDADRDRDRVPPPLPRRTVAARAPRRMAGPVRSALRLLLHRVELAAGVTGLDVLKALDEPDMPLLLAVLEYLQLNPASSVGALLGYWYGSPEGELLSRLAASEVLPGTDVEREFVDFMELLRQKAAKSSAESRLRELESLPLSEWTPAHKRQYLELLARQEPK